MKSGTPKCGSERSEHYDTHLGVPCSKIQEFVYQANKKTARLVNGRAGFLAPRRAPCFDTSVKTHTGLLLSKVTKPCIIDGLAEYGARWAEEVTRWSFKERFSVYTGGDGGTEN